MNASWQAAKTIIEKIEAHQYKAYIVGGAVRDKLLHRPICDVDIVTTAPPKEIHRLFNKTFQMNNEHNTVIVRIHNEQIEVTSIRADTVEEDLMRRDLTINSIALVGDRFIDPTNGIEDIRHKRLRSHIPTERMKEDPLRMLRVYRFMSELGFQVDEELQTVIEKQQDTIQTVAIERIVAEWIKLLQGKYRNNALHALCETSFYTKIPSLQLTKEAICTLAKLPPLHEHPELICWTAYFLCMQDKNDLSLRKLSLSNDMRRNIKDRLYYFEVRKRKNWTSYTLYKATIAVAKDVEMLRGFFSMKAVSDDTLKNMWKALPIHSRADLAISGHDLMKIKKPGPWMKEAFTWAERAVITGEIANEKESLLTAIRRRQK